MPAGYRNHSWHVYEEKEMSEETAVRYDLCLSLTGFPTAGAEQVREEIEAILGERYPGATVSVTEIREQAGLSEAGGIEVHITPLSVLTATLPLPFHRADILAALSEQYHRELTCLWHSVRDRRCVQGVIELRTWRQAGAQWICEFESYDRGAPAGHTYNWHLQNTSQWANQNTGWVGHQGAIVLDTDSGQISAHH
jgi:hypothetical protein